MVDCNNQYGWSMSQFLPTGGFKWMDEEKTVGEWESFIKSQENEQDKGYFLKVDLEYPKELHDLHDTFPCAPEHVEIKEEMLSDYQKKLAQDLGIKIGRKKLCFTLQVKKGYICHYRNLKLYLELGLKITKVSNVLQFNQSPWVREYIELNTEMRKKAKNNFEKTSQN